MNTDEDHQTPDKKDPRGLFFVLFVVLVAAGIWSTLGVPGAVNGFFGTCLVAAGLGLIYCVLGHFKERCAPATSSLGALFVVDLEPTGLVPVFVYLGLRPPQVF